ncbi:hypothetical protein E4J66_06230 [Actinomyces viscosus]|uniref:ARC6 IMS domain-containing protein n=1 Tax=Actinomyces viscosus TaxID=1656 RepID=A0A448PPF3_ACTVI|nr:hypothetical protein [Actinomyces viscosus]TFH52807.1 hypothetical protein E4J66_06230 [Actinomyces viscosus]VEI18429.1 Uncharacterised protein [Actinomyces viscosus]
MRSATRLLTALVTTILATGAAACSQQHASSAPSPSGGEASRTATASPAPTPVVLGEVDETDPDSVADAVAVALSVRDARTDTSSQAVWERAQPLLTGDLAASAQDAGAADVERPDNRWVMMQRHQAHDVVEDIDRATDDPVPDTVTRAQRQRAVTVRAHGDDGWSGLVRTTRYWLTLTNVNGAWRVSAVRSTID